MDRPSSETLAQRKPKEYNGIGYNLGNPCALKCPGSEQIVPIMGKNIMQVHCGLKDYNANVKNWIFYHDTPALPSMPSSP